MTATPADAHAGRWQLSPGVRLHWRHFDDDWLVYEAASGRTHLLNALSAFVAQSLEDGAASLDAIAEEARMAMGATDPSAARDAVADVLRQFRALGLVIDAE